MQYYGEAYLDSPLTKIDKLHVAREDVIATLSGIPLSYLLVCIRLL